MDTKEILLAAEAIKAQSVRLDALCRIKRRCMDADEAVVSLCSMLVFDTPLPQSELRSPLAAALADGVAKLIEESRRQIQAMATEMAGPPPNVVLGGRSLEQERGG